MAVESMRPVRISFPHQYGLKKSTRKPSLSLLIFGCVCGGSRYPNRRPPCFVFCVFTAFLSGIQMVHRARHGAACATSSRALPVRHGIGGSRPLLRTLHWLSLRDVLCSVDALLGQRVLPLALLGIGSTPLSSRGSTRSTSSSTCGTSPLIGGLTVPVAGLSTSEARSSSLPVTTGGTSEAGLDGGGADLVSASGLLLLDLLLGLGLRVTVCRRVVSVCIRKVQDKHNYVQK